MPVLKTTAQIKAIFGLGAKMRCSHDDLRELAFDVTDGRTNSLRKLTFAEANGMIRRLGGRVFDQPFGSRRTENHHKQQAGIKTVVTADHRAKLEKLRLGRGITVDGLTRMCLRMIKAERPRTAQECNKIIEALKAMNARDKTNPKSNIQNQKLRRAA